LGINNHKILISWESQVLVNLDSHKRIQLRKMEGQVK